MFRTLVRSLTLAVLAGVVFGPRAEGQDKTTIQKIEEALPQKAIAEPKAKRNVLIYSKTNGFRHGSIATGTRAFALMGDKTGAYTAVVTEDESYFAPEKLKAFDAVIMLNTTGDCLRPATPNKPNEPKKPKEPATDDVKSAEKYKKDLADYEAALPAYKSALAVYELKLKEVGPKAKELEETYKKALHDFVLSGKGLMGTHSATDTYGGWKAYNSMMGGTFAGHPWNSGDTVGIKIVEPKHPLNAPFDGKDFKIKDEIYQFRADTASPKDRLYLLTLDPDNTNMKIGGRKDGLYPISWVAKYGKGRTFYCSLGHNDQIYYNPTILRHYLGGLQYVLGDYDVPATETPVVTDESKK